MSNFAGLGVLATLSKHDVAGIIAILIGAAVVALGILRRVARLALLAAGAVVVVIGILLLSRTI
jgi:hypothetical protein